MPMPSVHQTEKTVQSERKVAVGEPDLTEHQLVVRQDDKQDQGSPPVAPGTGVKATFGKNLLHDWIVPICTVILTFIAIAGSFTAYYSYKSSVDTAQKQLQAYVGIDTPIIDMPDLRNPNYQPEAPEAGRLSCNSLVVPIKNYGQTVARDVTYNVALTTTDFGQSLPNDFNYEVKPTVPPGMEALSWHRCLFPQQQITAMTSINDGRMFVQALRKERTLFCHGYVDYEDIYKQRWRTTFCYVFAPNGNGAGRFTPYKEHNDTEKLVEKVGISAIPKSVVR